MLNILAQRLDRSPPVKERNKETDGIITSLDNLGKIVLTAWLDIFQDIPVCIFKKVLKNVLDLLKMYSKLFELNL